MKRFARDEQGYALVLTLLFMPVFLGLALMIIDISRGNNVHSDLYAAADAMALAAVGELDGGSDAIDRAELAMAEIANTVSFLSPSPGGSNRDIAPGEYTAIYLTDIPTNDETPIDQAWVNTYGTATDELAKFVYVRARPENGLRTIFPDPASLSATGDVDIWATAVAGRRQVACGITPLYICNPFEEEQFSGGDTFAQAFENGKLHGRLIKLHPGGADASSPGNFGFLTTGENGLDALRDYFAGGDVPECYDGETVTTEPGYKAAVAQGFNVRFDIWEGAMNSAYNSYKAAVHVRKGYEQGANACSWTPVWDQTLSTFTGFLDNQNMVAPGDGSGGTTPGAYIGNGDWSPETYFARNHGATTDPVTGITTLADGTVIDFDAMNTRPGAANPGIGGPSRHDVYMWERANGYITPKDATNGENGNPVCTMSKPTSAGSLSAPDPRLIQAAIVNCNQYYAQGRKDFPVEAYASIFLTHPLEPTNPPIFDENGNKIAMGTIDAEILDITGVGGLGTLDNYIRVEAVLLR